MKLHLSFDIPPLPVGISIRQPLVVMGSCFAEHVGSKLRAHKFGVTLNPSGIVFNPLSMATVLERCLDSRWYTPDELVLHNGLWHSWDHHGSFSHADANQALQQINTGMQQAQQALQSAGWLVLTFGSAWVYEHAETQHVVANCHKFAQQVFRKRMVSTKEIIQRFTPLLERLRAVNPGLNVLFTVSPVRYVRDGLVANTRSKAALHLAVQALTESVAGCYYFPAYEIVMDELRDYRFFERDLVHPNALAIDYVWERFMQTCLDDETKVCLVALLPVLQASAHRVLHASAEELESFTISMLSRLQKLQTKYPFLDLQQEREHFKSL